MSDPSGSNGPFVSVIDGCPPPFLAQTDYPPTGGFFLRILWMHLRVCWDMIPGKLFFWFSHIFGWGINTVLLTAALLATGVSNRIGSTCLPNHPHTIVDFWAWLIVFAGLAVAMQLATSVYCIWVYLRNVLADHRTTNTSAERTISSKVFNPISAEVTWSKVRKVLLSQWRGLAISILVIIEVGYFTTVFLKEDLFASSPMTPSRVLDLEMWGFCLIESNGDKNACLDQAKVLTLGPSTVLASVILVSLIGVEIFVLLGRPSLVTGWLDLLRYGDRQRQSEDNEDDSLAVGSGRLSCAGPRPDTSFPVPRNDLEKGFLDGDRVLQLHPHSVAKPLLPTPAVEETNPFDMSTPPPPLPKDTPRVESFAQNEQIPEELEVPEAAEAAGRPAHSTPERRSRFLESRSSREESDIGMLALQEMVQHNSLTSVPVGTGTQSRPISSPVPAIPKVVERSPSGSRLWRSLSKARREATIDLKAGRGGLALNPIAKGDEDI
ncbi:MAG: hypothetical protein Q9157_000343 [Trypethelium eluteriae]